MKKLLKMRLFKMAMSACCSISKLKFSFKSETFNIFEFEFLYILMIFVISVVQKIFIYLGIHLRILDI